MSQSLLRSEPRIETRLSRIKLEERKEKEQEWEAGKDRWRRERAMLILLRLQHRWPHMIRRDILLCGHSMLNFLEARQQAKYVIRKQIPDSRKNNHGCSFLFMTCPSGLGQPGFTSLLFFRRNPTPLSKIAFL